MQESYSALNTNLVVKSTGSLGEKSISEVTFSEYQQRLRTSSHDNFLQNWLSVVANYAHMYPLPVRSVSYAVPDR